MEVTVFSGIVALALLAGIFLGRKLFFRSGPELARLQAELAAEESRRVSLQKELLAAREQIETMQRQILDAHAEAARRSQEVQDLKERLAEWRTEEDTRREQFRGEFQQMAQEILLSNSKQLTENSQMQLGSLLQPFSDHLQIFARRLDENREKQLAETSSLKEQIQQLSQLNQTITAEARNLATAIKGESKTMGDWGEMQLSRILELSGLVRGRDYETQKVFKKQGSLERFIPDVIVYLPEEKNIIIDAKVSLTAFTRYASADNEESRALALRDHLLSVKRHVDELSRRSYQDLEGLSSPDFVLLFIPVEPAFTVVTREQPHFFHETLEKNIIVVTASTLVATLRVVAGIWRQENQERNARSIAAMGGKLYDKLVGVAEEFEKLGAHLRQVQDSYDSSLKRLATGKGNAVAAAEKLRKLGASSRKRMPRRLVDLTEEAQLFSDLETEKEFADTESQF
ncbi:MAG: DNA recombination protein RmuC [Spirochaetales bacterium]|nr:DNA recombination protein RmuC [Spirochaetales bacterium]